MAERDDDLLNAIEQLEAEAIGFASGDLATARSKSIDRYLCEPYGNEIEGRSQVVSTDLRDVVEWIVPQWLKVVLSGDEVVQFAPTGPSDEKAAKLETSFVNHVILQKNDALVVMSTWARDALMSKNGYVKAYAEKKDDIRTERYEGLTEDAFNLLLADREVELVGHDEVPDYQTPLQPAPQPPPQQPPMQGGAPGPLTPAPNGEVAPPPMQPPPPMVEPPMLHNVVVRRVYPCTVVRIENVPPEEIRVHKSVKTTNLQDAVFVQHRTKLSLSAIRQMGFDVPDDIPTDEPAPNDDSIVEARDRWNEENDLASGTDANREAWLSDTYIRYDADGDGIAELRRVVHIGRTVLENEETDLIPIASMTPIIFPHRHIGLGYDDLVEQQGMVKTALMRGGLDNLYAQVNGRFVADDTRVNIDDLLVSRPNGVIRARGDTQTAVTQLATPNTFPVALQGMEWTDAWRENSTGVSAYYQGMNADALNKTAHGVAQIMSASQQRVEAVIRTFANGLRDLCYIVHALTLKNATGPEKFKVNEDWVTIDPREWVKRDNLVVTVGLGSGTRETRIQQLMALWQLQMQGLAVGIAKPQNLHETGRRINEEMGYRDSNAFWSDPSKSPPTPPQPPPEIVKTQMQLQADAQKFHAQSQLDQQNEQRQMQIELAKLERQAELDRYKVDKDAATKLALKQMELQFAEHGKQIDVAVTREGRMPMPPHEDTVAIAEKLAQAIAQLRAEIATPRERKIIRGPDGRVKGLH